MTGQIQQKNLSGTGDSISLKAYLGQSASRYILSYNKPWLFGTPLSGGIDLYDWERAYQDFTKQSIGFKVRVGYPVGMYSNMTLFYVWESSKISDLDTIASTDPMFLRNSTGFEVKSGLGFTFERNTTDHPFLPTKGTYLGASLEYDSKSFGGDYDLFKQEYHAGLYYPLFWKFVGHVRAEVGWENCPEGINGFPVYERYFLGGINSLRGWQFGEVGPLDSYGLVYGGDKYAITNFEILFPLVEKYGVRGVLFFDAGNAFPEGTNIDPSKFREDIGPGLRWNSPFGPLRIEVGYVLDPRPGDKPYQFQFTAGAFF